MTDSTPLQRRTVRRFTFQNSKLARYAITLLMDGSGHAEKMGKGVRLSGEGGKPERTPLQVDAERVDAFRTADQSFLCHGAIFNGRKRLDTILRDAPGLDRSDA
jgi:hypothetical protein